jgi:hypothetical protein
MPQILRNKNHQSAKNANVGGREKKFLGNVCWGRRTVPPVTNREKICQKNVENSTARRHNGMLKKMFFFFCHLINKTDYRGVQLSLENFFKK